ncbi:unnamed protein product [Linum trigynum]|uniref:H15 domain-containing protein n=1 Tax=Linum trigynum TaxID=586398 RepID=A0AAV2EAJ6_9ROSI
MAETEPAVVAAVPAADAKSKAKKPAVKKPRAARNYPSFEEMISDAIVALKERTGSSQIAITKYIEDKHKNLPPNFRKMLLFQLKRLVAAEKLVKVKASFKLPSGRSASPPAAAAVAKKPAAAAKPKAAAAKPKAATTKVVVKPKAKTAAKPKPKAAAKPTAAAAKPAAKVQPKRKTTAPAAKPVAKKAKLAKAASPGKKKAAPKPKKAAPKPKSVKSPIKKAAGTKRTRK